MEVVRSGLDLAFVWGLVAAGCADGLSVGYEGKREFRGLETERSRRCGMAYGERGGRWVGQ